MFRRRSLRQLVPLLALLPIASPLLAAPKNDKTAPPAAAVESRTGTIQVTWNLPNKADLPKIVAALFDRFGWTIPDDARGNLVQTLKEFDTRQNGSDGGEKLPADRPKPPVKVAANDDPPLYTVYVPASYEDYALTRDFSVSTDARAIDQELSPHPVPHSPDATNPWR